MTSITTFSYFILCEVPKHPIKCYYIIYYEKYYKQLKEQQINDFLKIYTSAIRMTNLNEEEQRIKIEIELFSG
jgi:hypothetical protein